MKRLLLIALSATAASGVAATPALVGLVGNPSFSHQIQVQVPSQAKSPELSDDSAQIIRGTTSPAHVSPATEPERSGSAEPGDDNGTDATGTTEPGDDNGATESSEPGDDNGTVSETEPAETHSESRSAEPSESESGGEDHPTATTTTESGDDHSGSDSSSPDAQPTETRTSGDNSVSDSGTSGSDG